MLSGILKKSKVDSQNINLTLNSKYSYDIAAPAALLRVFLQVNLVFISVNIKRIRSILPFIKYVCDGHYSNLMSLTHYSLVCKGIFMLIHQHT